MSEASERSVGAEGQLTPVSLTGASDLPRDSSGDGGAVASAPDEAVAGRCSGDPGSIPGHPRSCPVCKPFPGDPCVCGWEHL